MESNRLDKLFQHQLADHEVPVSAQAWSRLEAAKAGKKKAFSWWMIAASLVLLISFGLYFTRFQASEINSPELAQAQTLPKEETPEVLAGIAETTQEEPSKIASNYQPEPESTATVAVALSPTGSAQASKTMEAASVVEEKQIRKEIASIQTHISQSLTLAFDPETIVVPEHLAAPKKVIESAGMRVEIYQNLTASDSVKMAVVQQKNLLKRVVNAALDVKNGEKELSEVLKLDKLELPLERKNN
jgi:hypothetical protein